MQPPLQLIQRLERQSLQPTSLELEALQQALQARYEEAVQAILFYGSCLRTQNPWDGLVDLYVIVDSYQNAYHQRRLQVLNRLLPPNVFYLEVSVADRVLRAKYAVLSLRDFQYGASSWFHSYLWGRFAQPTALLYSRDEKVTAKIGNALAQAVMTLIDRALPAVAPSFTAIELWRSALSLSYSAELRVERPERTAELVAFHADHYRELTPIVLDALPYTVYTDTTVEPVRYLAVITAASRRRHRLAWWARRRQGKCLSLLRLSKSLLTFQGGVDYILWKLERHANTPIPVTPALRRYPLLLGWGLIWRLYRRRILR